MSDKIEVDIKCAHCGKQLQSDEQPCPYCGHIGRNINVNLSESGGISLTESMEGKLKNSAAKVKKHIVQEVHKGDSYWQDGKKNVERIIVVDRKENIYKEVVKDQETGQVIHSAAEPLGKHVGHGSAKKKKND